MPIVATVYDDRFSLLRMRSLQFFVKQHNESLIYKTQELHGQTSSGSQNHSIPRVEIERLPLLDSSSVLPH